MENKRIHQANRDEKSLANNGGKTGWPPGLLQDDNAQLSRWLASRGHAQALVKENILPCGHLIGYCQCRK